MTKTTEKRLVQMPAVEHIKSIKQKLREAKSKYEHNTGASKPLTAYSLHKLLEEKELPTLAISALQNMFNPELNSKTIDVTMVAILCKLFDVNLSYVLALPEDQAMLPEYSSYNSAFQALTDPYYLGTFTGYMLRTAYATDTNADTCKQDTLRKNDSLVKCTIEMTNKNNHTTAEMIIHNQTTHVDGKEINCDSHLTGIPVHITRTNNIFINFVSEHGKYYTVMFDHQVFYNAPMYYREAIIMTSATGNQKLPLVSKMVIFKNEVPQEYHKYILGLLSFNVSNIIISEDKLNSMKNVPEIARFCTEFADHLNLHLRPYYVIPEAIIEQNPTTTMTPKELKKVLLLLRNESYSLAQIEVGNDSKASIIAKDIQQYHIPANFNE